MEHKTAVLNTRIEPALKQHAEQILSGLGLSNAEAIRIFYNQICLHNGLPFDVKIPNKKTLNSMEDADSGKTFKADDIDSLIDEA